MKILNIVDNKWWSGNAYYAVYSAYALHRLGHDVGVTGNPEAPWKKKAENLGLKIYDDFNPRENRPFRYRGEVKNLNQIVLDNGYEVIIAHSSAAHLYASRVQKKSGGRIKIIRGLSEEGTPKRNIFNRMMHKNHTDAYIASCSTLAGKYKEAFGIDDTKMNVIIGPIDLDRYDGVDGGEAENESDNIVYGLVARLSPVKGHDIFLHAASIVAEQIPGARFVISGEESQVKEQQLKAEAVRLGISSRTEFPGKMEHPKEVIASLDVGVIPSTFSEVICRVAMEYMAEGIPVICSDVNALPEVVADGETGFVVPNGDVEALAEAMIKMGENEELRVKMGGAGRKRVEEALSLKPFGEKIEKVVACAVS